MSSLGEKDVAHIRHMIRRARGSAIAGRAMIGLGFDPITFIVGVAALAHAKIVENMEIGHNVMHGQYDRSEEHTSELQSLMRISYDVFCLKKKNTTQGTQIEQVIDQYQTR